jgi:hypothetical protein
MRGSDIRLGPVSLTAGIKHPTYGRHNYSMNSIVEIKLQCCLNIVTILPHDTSFSIATRKSVPKVGTITADIKFIFVSAV